jgi:hypothetical protein
VQSGALGRFDAIDQTDGGNSSRYSLSGPAAVHDEVFNGINAAIRQKLNPFSNFTYFRQPRERPVQPVDRRTTTVFNASQTTTTLLGGRPISRWRAVSKRQHCQRPEQQAAR